MIKGPTEPGVGENQHGLPPTQNVPVLVENWPENEM